MAVRKIKVPPRFIVEAVSRLPRLGIDYNPVTHAFTDSYLNPLGYSITVEDFPGKTLVVDNAEPAQQRPGSRPHKLPDVFELDVPAGTTGWEFTITGQPDKKGLVGHRPPKFTAHGASHLVARTGVFHEDRSDNVWNHRFTVPGPGVYTVTSNQMSGAVVNVSKTANLLIQDYLIVSIGDSAASGEGNPDVPGVPEGFDPDLSWFDVFDPVNAIFKIGAAAAEFAKEKLVENSAQIARKGNAHIAMDPDPVWMEVNAHRSLRSGHGFAAQLLEDRRKGTLVTFLPFGRTGAEIPRGLIGPRTDRDRPIDGWIGNVGEINEVVNSVGLRRIDALLIYVGVDDMGVSSTLENLVAGDSPIFGQGDAGQARKDAEDTANQNLALLPQKFVDLKDALAALNVGQVYVTEYPSALFEDAKGVPAHGCELFSGPQLDLSRLDAEFVTSLAHQLNLALAAAAKEHNWIYVDGIEAAFHNQDGRGHGYCTPSGQRFFVQCSESLVSQGDTNGSIHPNDLGHAAVGRAVAASVRANTIQAIPQAATHPSLGAGQVGPVAAPPGTAGQPSR